jgi:hypothetical protein
VSTVGTVPVGKEWDDEEILGQLRQAIRARQAVPADFISAAKNAFAWHNIDAELAQLTYDSIRDAGLAPAMRTAEAASIRALTFTSTRLSIELEVTAHSLVGQVVPAQSAMIRVLSRSGEEVEVPADDIGCFRIYPIPPQPFRLQCRTQAGVDALTGWITL